MITRGAHRFWSFSGSCTPFHRVKHDRCGARGTNVVSKTVPCCASAILSIPRGFSPRHQLRQWSMMTQQPYLRLACENDGTMLRSRSVRCKLLFAAAVLISLAGDRCVAQHIIYHDSYPLTNSYPASYPADTSTSVVRSSPIVYDGSFDNTNSRPTAGHDTVARRTTADRFSPRPRAADVVAPKFDRFSASSP